MAEKAAAAKGNKGLHFSLRGHKNSAVLQVAICVYFNVFLLFCLFFQNFVKHAVVRITEVIANYTKLKF